MIVQPPDRRRKTPTLGENREVALGVVVMSIATALLLTYFLGFYCDGREGWPCLASPARMAEESEAQPPPEAPGGAGPGLAPAALTPLNPALMVPSAPTQPTEPFVPPTAAQPTGLPVTPTALPKTPTAGATPSVPGGLRTPTPRVPESGSPGPGRPPATGRTATPTANGSTATGSPPATSYPPPGATATPGGYPSPSSPP